MLLEKLRKFITEAGSAAAVEPGELPFLLDAEHHTLSAGPQGVLLEAWDAERNLARRIVREIKSAGHKLELETVRFGGRTGRLTLVDLEHGRGWNAVRQATRDVLRERLRVMMARQFPGWHVAELTSGADLENSLSPTCPRALLKKGEMRWAVLAAPATPASETALTYGLIWLDYLRRREQPHGVEGLALFVPASEVQATRLRLACLHRQAIRYRLFSYDDAGGERPEDLEDMGNLDTAVEPAPTSPLHETDNLAAWIRRLSDLPEVEVIATAAAEWSLRVRGLQFASIRNGEVWCGLDRPTRVRSAAPVEALAAQLAAVRRVDPPDDSHPWLRARPEAWLESVVRNNLTTLDPTLLPEPVYGQVPSLGGGERGVLDLLAIDHQGRLCVIELKATEDPGLPMQALDYWWHVARHAERGDFQARGYFRGLDIRPEPPRLLLVAPALAFHPTTETLLSYFAPSLEVERAGLGVEWQARARVVLRVRGARHPEWSPAAGRSKNGPH